MRTNPGRRARRFRRHGHRQPTRMTEYQRNQQALLDRHDGMRCHLGINDSDGVEELGVELDAETDGAAAESDDNDDGDDTYKGGHLASGAREATAYERAILGALQHKPVYPKSVHPDVIAARRHRNKRARRARRQNRSATALLMVVMLFFGAALYYSVPAKADPIDSAAYLKVLDAAGITFPDSVTALIAGQQACDYLDSHTMTDAINQVWRISQLDRAHSAYLVGVAAAAFCPWRIDADGALT